MSECPRILSEYSPKILKINIKTFRPWIEKRITELSQGVEDEILWDLLYNYLEDAQKRARREGPEANPSGGLNGRDIQTVLSSFLGSKTALIFIEELFNLLKSAEFGHLDGIPPEFGIKPEEAEREAFGLIKESLKTSELKISDRLEREIRRTDRFNHHHAHAHAHDRDHDSHNQHVHDKYHRDDKSYSYRYSYRSDRNENRRDRRDIRSPDRRDTRHRDIYSRRDREADHSHYRSHARKDGTDYLNERSAHYTKSHNHKDPYALSLDSNSKNRSRSRSRSRGRRSHRSRSRSYSPDKVRTRVRKSPIQSSDSDSPSHHYHHSDNQQKVLEGWENSGSNAARIPQAPKLQENIPDALQQALREKARQSLVKKDQNQIKK